MKKALNTLAEFALVTFTMGLAMVACIGIWSGTTSVISALQGPQPFPTLAHLEPLPAQLGSYSVDAEPVTGPIDFSASVGYAEKVEAGHRFIDDRR